MRASEYVAIIERAVRRITTYRPRARLVLGVGNDDADFVGVQWRPEKELLAPLARRVTDGNRTLSAQMGKARSTRWNDDRRRWLSQFGDADGSKADGDGDGDGGLGLVGLLAAKKVANKLRSDRSERKATRLDSAVGEYKRPASASGASHRPSPTLTSGGPTLRSASRHRLAPILKSSKSANDLRSGKTGWVMISGLNRQLSGDMQLIMPPPSITSLQGNPAGTFACFPLYDRRPQQATGNWTMKAWIAPDQK